MNSRRSPVFFGFFVFLVFLAFPCTSTTSVFRNGPPTLSPVSTCFAESSDRGRTEYPLLPVPWEYLGCVFDARVDSVLQTNFFVDRLDIYPACPGLEMINVGHHGGTHVVIQYQENGLWRWRPALYPDKGSIPQLDLFRACYFVRDPETPGAYFLTYQESGPTGTHVLFYITPRPVSDPAEQPYDGNALLTGRDESDDPGDPVCYGGMWSLPVPFSHGGRPCLLALTNGYTKGEGAGPCYSTYALVHWLDSGETWGSIPRNRYQHVWIASDTSWVPMQWNALDILGGQPILGQSSMTMVAEEVFTAGGSTYLLVAGGATKNAEVWEDTTSVGFVTLYRFLNGPAPGPGMDYRVEIAQEIVDPHDTHPGSPAMVGGYRPAFMNPIRVTGGIETVPSFVCGLTRRPADDPDRWVHDYDGRVEPVPGGFVILRGRMGNSGPEFDLQPPYPGDVDVAYSYPAITWPGESRDDVVMKTPWWAGDHPIVLHIPNENGSFHLNHASVLFRLDDIVASQDWRASYIQACFMGLLPNVGGNPSRDLVLPLSCVDRVDSADELHTYIVWKSVPTAVNDEGAAGFVDAPVSESYPNPFTEDAFLRCTLPRPGPVRLAICDPGGRKLRTVTGEFPAGALRLQWDGRDDAGRKTPTGAYFYRLEIGGRVSRGRMVKVK